jgi:predicted CXXCH cytochrome family protein
VKCGKCHAEIYRNYLSTPMANASGVATEKLIPGGYTHPITALHYDIALQGAQAVLTTRDRGSQNEVVQRPLSFFLGSGHLATTYLYSINDFLFESPVAWYAASNTYDMKPGLAEMKQIPPSLPMESSCLRCHMSSVQPSDSGTINRYKGLAFLHTGITCEACHGDAEKHAVSGKKAPVVNPARLTADQRDSICVSCHLEGDVTVERSGYSALDYRPGEPISKYLAFYVYGGENPTARGVSEVEQFAKSTCKQASGDKMSCTSCHDPHFTPSASQRTAFFRSKCLACHSQPSFIAAHHPENQDCTSCHMRRTGAENIPHVAWTDHRILRLPAPAATASQSDTADELAPILSPGATMRDLAMANYKAMLDGNPSLEPKAWSQLQSQRIEITDDREALDALGVVSAARGDGDAAEQAFRRVLELAPDDLTALSNFGALQEKRGNRKEALSLLRQAFARNQAISGLAMNLARVECAAGDPAAARSTLQTTLAYNPGLEDARLLLTQLSDCGGPKGKP